jgi:hypothetical protein
MLGSMLPHGATFRSMVSLRSMPKGAMLIRGSIMLLVALLAPGGQACQRIGPFVR